jgi:hypothetical protein
MKTTVGLDGTFARGGFGAETETGARRGSGAETEAGARGGSGAAMEAVCCLSDGDPANMRQARLASFPGLRASPRHFF